MALEPGLRRILHVAATSIALLLSLASLTLNWWTVEASFPYGSGRSFDFRGFEAGPYRSHGSYLDDFDGALDAAVAWAGALVTVALVAFAAVVVFAFVGPLRLRAPAWTPRAAIVVGVVAVAAAAIVAPMTWPDEWREYANNRGSSFGVRIDHAEWDGRWDTGQGATVIYSARAGWLFGFAAAVVGAATLAFDVWASRGPAPVARPRPAVAVTREACEAAPPAPPPPPKPDFTRRY